MYVKKLYKGIVMYISHILNVSDAIFIDNNKDGCPVQQRPSLVCNILYKIYVHAAVSLLNM